MQFREPCELAFWYSTLYQHAGKIISLSGSQRLSVLTIYFCPYICKMRIYIINMFSENKVKPILSWDLI